MEPFFVSSKLPLAAQMVIPRNVFSLETASSDCQPPSGCMSAFMRVTAEKKV